MGRGAGAPERNPPALNRARKRRRLRPTPSAVFDPAPHALAPAAEQLARIRDPAVAVKVAGEEAVVRPHLSIYIYTSRVISIITIHCEDSKKQVVRDSHVQFLTKNLSGPVEGP